MNTEQLKEYLGIAVDLEKHIHLQNELCKALQYKADGLGHSKYYPAPDEADFMKNLPSRVKLPVKVIPDKSTKYTDAEQKLKKGKRNLIIAAVLYLIHVIISTNYLLSVDFGGIAALACLIGFSLGIYSITQIVGGTREVKKESDNYQQTCKLKEADYQYYLKEYNDKEKAYEAALKKAEEEYNNAKCEYENAIADDKLRVLAEKQEREVYLENIRRIKEHVEQSEIKLGMIYSRDVVYSKYRNLPMLSSLYEYISSAICTKLEGYDGAYNKLDNEILLNRIIDRLDSINENLEQIKRNQYILYMAINDTNKKIDRLIDSTERVGRAINGMVFQITEQGRMIQSQNEMLDGQLMLMQEQKAMISRKMAELQANSELTAYHSERTAKELEYMNRMDYIMGRNNTSWA